VFDPKLSGDKLANHGPGLAPFIPKPYGPKPKKAKKKANPPVKPNGKGKGITHRISPRLNALW
jgi:hypothetical protein